MNTARVQFTVDLPPGHPCVIVEVKANPLIAERGHRRRGKPRQNRPSPPQQEAQRVENRPTARPASPRVAGLLASTAPTFRQAAEAYIDANRSSWKNEKHAAQWEAPLER